eukprot:scaffold1584_cov76-Skeletonema_dohrnii-CCMP3373.AAC.1
MFRFVIFLAVDTAILNEIACVALFGQCDFIVNFFCNAAGGTAVIVFSSACHIFVSSSVCAHDDEIGRSLSASIL